MFRQGAETVEAVVLSVERASPKGLALFLFGAATEPNCAQNNNPGVAHFAGPPRRRSRHAQAITEHRQPTVTPPDAFPSGRYRVAPYVPAALKCIPTP